MSAWMTGSDRGRLLGAAPHLYLLIALLSALHFAPLGVDHPFSRVVKVAMVLLLIGATALLTLLDALRHIPPAATETVTRTNIDKHKRARAR